MRIAVNTRFLLPGKLEGIGWFTFETLKRIVEQHPEHEFYFLFDRPFSNEFVFADNVKPIVISPPARHPFLWYWWFEWSIPAAIKKIKPDVFLSTDGYLSLKVKVPQILVMHDLAFEHFPDHVNKLTRIYYRYYSPKFANKAKRIATVSEYSKEDIHQHYQIPIDKIDVVYNGSNELFVPLSENEKLEVKQKYADGNNYFIYAGAIQPRKNVGNLFLAFEQFKMETISTTKLIIAGRKAWHTEAAMHTLDTLKYKNDIIFTGHLERSELSKLMGGAIALAYVSLFEGFGIPLVEAMSCHVPIITSNVSSMPEVAGMAALQVNPKDVNEICKALIRIETDQALRALLISNGIEQRKKFGWQQTADKLWQCMMTGLKTG